MIHERFWKYVDKRGDDECWEWTGAKKATGYGVFKFYTGIQLRAHRYSWELHNGKLEKGIHVLHKCDNRACVNPAHLFLGDHNTNMADMTKKGRAPRGERNCKAALTEDDVRAIRKRRAAGELYKDISADYPVSHGAVRNAAIGKTWKHI